MKFHIDKTGESPLCRMYRVENTAVSHILSECKMLAQKEYKKKHDKFDDDQILLLLTKPRRKLRS